jgi:PAS domain S-box-containing protein
MSVAVISLVGSLIVISQTIMVQSTAAMERKATSQSVSRVLNVLSNELDDLNATTQDYATWDDTYAFVRDDNRNYIDLNLMDATFANLRLNIMLFVNISDQVLFGKAYDLNNGTEIHVPQSLLSQVIANPLILRRDSMKTPVVGTILLPEGPLLIASGPILKSDGQGPVGGTLITGRFLDSTELAFLGKTTQLPLALQVIADSPISSDFQTANLSISKESPIFVQPLNDKRVAGYTLLDDVYGNPILMLRADMPRDIYAQGLASTFYIAVSLVVMGIVFGSLTMLLLEKSVVSRLSRLSIVVGEIGRSSDLSIRVPEAGKDELSSLGEGINRMLSVLRQSEGALRESEEKLRNTIESSPDAITLIGTDGKVVDCNQAALEIFGYAKKEEMVGEDGFAVISSKDRAKVMEGLTALPQKGSIKNIGVRMVAKDGREFVAEVSASLVRDASGNPKYVVTLVRDITERKQMEQKLEEYSQQLEEMVEYRTKQLKDTQERLVKSERLAAIGQVTAMVGHDLRNPLTGISGAAYYLKMKLGANAEKKMLEMLEIIEKDIQYSNKIITDLIDYSREIKLELTETTPKSIIAESIFLAQVPEKVQLADSTQNEPRIKIDIDKMKRVFANFIKNAVEAMPQGGKLAISSRVSGNDVEFTFIDTGVGIAKEVSEKIWTPFFTTKAKGMGLGLAICKRIVEAHQGKISVDSIVGEGTTFTITIPLEPKPRVEGGEKVWVNVPESLLSTTTKA